MTNDALYTLPKNIQTRWASPENWDGAKGTAGQALNGRKGSPCFAMKAGEQKVLAQAENTSGTIRRIWITINDRSPRMLRGLRLDMFWDGADRPAVSAPLGDFFGQGLGRCVAFQSALFSNPEGRSFNCCVPMPFCTGMKIVVTNESGADLSMFFFDVNYTLGDEHGPDTLYLHAHWRRERPTTLKRDYEFLPQVSGRGRFLGVNVGVTADKETYFNSWWGEGECKIYLDGDREFPTLCGTGTEDYIGTAWGQGHYAHLYQGCHIADHENMQFAFYRHHIPDPVYFHRDIRVTMHQIGCWGPGNIGRMRDAGRSLESNSGGPVDMDKAVEANGHGLFERSDDWSSSPEMPSARDVPNESGWGTMPVPGFWQQHGHNYSAVMWFRRRVTLPPAMIGRDLTLHLGAVDKHDITYAGGVEVGRTGTGFDTMVHDRIRTYLIPAARTQGGELVLAVRAYSFMYAGGLTGPAESMRITLQGDDDGGSIPLAGDWRFHVEHDLGLVDLTLPGLEHGNHQSPYMLFENMIKPLLPVGIAGAIWYQGEANAGDPAPYRRLLRDLIEDWRYNFGLGDFPFGVVQLPNFRELADYQPDATWARMRAAQAAVLKLPRTGLAVSIDCGEAGDIHPGDKKTVGLRLARWALAEVYGRGALAGGPLYQDHRVEGSRIRIFFRNVGEALALKHGGQVRTLVIAGRDLCFRPAQSVLDGRTLVVWHENIEVPVAVPYAWADNPAAANLMNTEGEPAGPFCTEGGIP